jgi:hypothetical protein
VLHQKHYGSDGQYAYTLHWEYDHLGNMTKEVNAIGEARYIGMMAMAIKLRSKDPIFLIIKNSYTTLPIV